MEKQKKQLAVAFMVVLVAVVVVSVIGIIAMSNKPVILQGQIEATEIRISGKFLVSGRSFYRDTGCRG